MISIIIIVKNDRKIEDTLLNLEKQIASNKAEIIVVDASSGALDDIKTKFKSVRWIYFQNIKKKKLTIPDQRNIGIKKSKGNIIVFIDSDCVPEYNWLNELTHLITINKEKIVAGKVLVKEKGSIHELEYSKLTAAKYIGECPTMNVAYAKEIFENVGYFDENFRYGSDVDLAWRATRKGYKIRYNTKAIIYHDLGTFKHEIKRMFLYGTARVKLYRKHPYRIKFLLEESQKILYPLFFLFLPIFFWLPIYLLLFIFLFIANPGGSLLSKLKRIVLKTAYGAGMLKGYLFMY